MAVYCISDIHGYYTDFMTLLDKVSPRESDIIYVLGDIIDRGPESAQMLKWAINESNNNVKFLLGNHEDMSAAAIMSDPEYIDLRMQDNWSYNGGSETIQQLLTETTVEWRINELVPWLQNLPLYDVINVKDQQWMLVHAGFDCSGFDKEIQVSCWRDGNYDRFSRQEEVDLKEYGFGMQFAQDLLWSRYEWISYRKPSPVSTVFGHTVISKKLVEYLQEKGLPCKGGDGKAMHLFNRICIDCGCGVRENFSENWNLCMLRLDDMEEFYLKN